MQCRIACPSCCNSSVQINSVVSKTLRSAPTPSSRTRGTIPEGFHYRNVMSCDANRLCHCSTDRCIASGIRPFMVRFGWGTTRRD